MLRAAAPHRAAWVRVVRETAGQGFRLGRQAGGSASENTSTSSPVIVEMSWGTLTSFTPTAISTISAGRYDPVVTIRVRSCFTRPRPLPLVLP